MKSCSRAVYWGVALVFGAFTGALRASEAFVDSNPVGAVRHWIPPGLSILSPPMLRPATFVGSVNSVNGIEVGLAHLPVMPDEPCYLHILSGAGVGTVDSVVSAEGYFLETEFGIARLAVGDRVAIRPHQTVGGLFQDQAIGDSTAVTLFDTNGTIRNLIFYSGFGWYTQSFEPADDYLVFPGEGLVINSTQAVELIFSGDVATHPVNVALGSGEIAIVGSNNPAVGVSVEQLFGEGLAGDSTLTVFVNEHGLLIMDLNLTHYEGFGWYNSAFEWMGDQLLLPLEGAVLVPGQSGLLQLPAAYVSGGVE